MMNHAFFFYILVYVLNLNFEAFVISIDIRSPDRENSSGQYVMVDIVNNRPAYKVSFLLLLNETNSRF